MIRNRATLHPLIAVLALTFATVVLAVSLMSASVSNSLRDPTSSSRVIRFSSRIVPGHILYPLTVLRDKFTLSLMTTADQCLEMLDIAKERLSQAEQLIELKDTQTALETIIKGQRYIADAADQCQRHQLTPQYRQSILLTIDLYQEQLREMKQYYLDNDRAVIDQLMSENEALSRQLGGK
jgi:hypothetical protein